MHTTFEDAFAGVKNALEKKLFVSYRLLTELRRRSILSPRKIDDVKVSEVTFQRDALYKSTFYLLTNFTYLCVYK